MIERELLTSLGWSDDLIEEVNRVSNALDKAAGDIQPCTEVFYAAEHSAASTELFINNDHINTNFKYFVR